MSYYLNWVRRNSRLFRYKVYYLLFFVQLISFDSIYGINGDSLRCYKYRIISTKAQKNKIYDSNKKNKFYKNKICILDSAKWMQYYLINPSLKETKTYYYGSFNFFLNKDSIIEMNILCANSDSIKKYNFLSLRDSVFSTFDFESQLSSPYIASIKKYNVMRIHNTSTNHYAFKFSEKFYSSNIGERYFIMVINPKDLSLIKIQYFVNSQLLYELVEEQNKMRIRKQQRKLQKCRINKSH